MDPTCQAQPSSPKRCLDNVSFVTGKGQFSAMINSKMQSKLLIKFMKDCEKLMGRLVKQDLGVSIEMLLAILEIYKDELADKTVTKLRKLFVVTCASTFLIMWVGTLRGGKVFMLEVPEFVKRRDNGRNNSMGHVVVPLMGRIKNKREREIWSLSSQTKLTVVLKLESGLTDSRRC